MYVPRAFSHEGEFLEAVARVERQLAPEVVRIETTFGYDWTEDPSVSFMVILADAVTGPDLLLTMYHKVRDSIKQQIAPLEEWGVLPYFNVRSKSEQDMLNQRIVA